MLTDKSNEVYFQIVPVLTSNSAGKRETTYALLDTWSQSTLIREDFAAEFKLHGKKTKIKTSSIKNQRQSIIVHEVDWRISSTVNNNPDPKKPAHEVIFSRKKNEETHASVLYSVFFS